MKLLILTLILLWGGQVQGQTATPTTPAAKDSVNLFKQVLKIHLTQPERAFHLLDSMETHHLKPLSQIQIYRGLVYGSQAQYHLSLNYLEKALQDESLRQEPVLYLQAVSCGVTAYRKLEQHKEGLQLLRQGLDFARQHKHVLTEAEFLFTAGQVLYQLDEKKKAHDYFQQAIRLGEETEGMRLKPFLSYFYGEIFSYCMTEKRYDEALAYCEKREKLIEYMAQHRVPKGYIDQQYAYLYSKKATLLAQMGRTREADAVFQRFLKTQAAAQPLMVDAYTTFELAMHRFHPLIERLTPTLQTTDTISYLFADRLNGLAKAYQGLGKYPQAYRLQQRREVILDSLTRRKMQSEMAEMATVFQLKEKDLQILQQETQLNHNRTVRYFLIAGIVLLAILLRFSIHHSRTVKEKNRLLVKKINEFYHFQQQVEQAEQVENSWPPTDEVSKNFDLETAAAHRATRSAETCQTQPGTEASVKTHTEAHADALAETLAEALAEAHTEAHAEADVKVHAEADVKADVKADEEAKMEVDTEAEAKTDLDPKLSLALFKRLDHLIQEEQLYLNPNLSRQDLADHFAIDKKFFSRLLQEHLQQSLPQYLTELRIRHAVLLMQRKPHYTLQAIAEESGYANLRQFQRAFKNVHGMTPSEFKSAAS